MRADNREGTVGRLEEEGAAEVYNLNHRISTSKPSIQNEVEVSGKSNNKKRKVRSVYREDENNIGCIVVYQFSMVVRTVAAENSPSCHSTMNGSRTKVHVKRVPNSRGDNTSLESLPVQDTAKLRGQLRIIGCSSLSLRGEKQRTRPVQCRPAFGGTPIGRWCCTRREGCPVVFSCLVSSSTLGMMTRLLDCKRREVT